MNQALILKFIEEVIINISGKLSVKIGLNDSTDTIEEWDSLVTMTLAANLNSEYGVDLDIDDLEKVSSVKGICHLLSIKK